MYQVLVVAISLPLILICCFIIQILSYISVEPIRPFRIMFKIHHLILQIANHLLVTLILQPAAIFSIFKTKDWNRMNLQSLMW